MSVFQDKKFEQLDWISQATEPIDSQLNEILAQMPESIDIDFDFYNRVRNSSWFDINVASVLLTKISELNLPSQSMIHAQITVLERYFEFQVSGTSLIIDFEEHKIVGGTIKLVKLANTMEEKDLKHILGQEGQDLVRYMSIGTPHQINCLNEVMEILGKCDEGLKTRSIYKKRRFLDNRLKQLFKDNEWNIRDTELANKVGIWIKHYVQDGEIAAFANLCKLKVMTHKGQPIYSIEEVV